MKREIAICREVESEWMEREGERDRQGERNDGERWRERRRDGWMDGERERERQREREREAIRAEIKRQKESERFRLFSHVFNFSHVVFVGITRIHKYMNTVLR